MGIIDCHCHIFPNLQQFSDELPPGLRDIVQKKIPAIENFGTSLFDSLPVKLPQIPIAPQHLANLRKDGVGPLHNGLEYFSSLSLAPKTLFQGTLKKLLSSMERNDIERSVVIAAPPIASNQWLLKIAVDHSDKIVPICHMPKLPAETGPIAWRHQFETMVRQGARGFKIHPNLTNYPPDHISFEALFETAQRNNLFVIIHTGCFNIPSYTNQNAAEPSLFAPLFERYRDVRVCLAHMNRDHPERAWDMMKRYENVYADTSWQTSSSIASAINQVGSERLVLGSDWPLLNDDLQTDNLQAVTQACSTSDFEKLTNINALRLTGLNS